MIRRRTRPHLNRSIFALTLASLLLHSGPLSSQRGSPPFPADVALKTIRVADGFEVELFASEPLISSPVAMEVDEAGRLFVVEMRGYPLDVSGSGRVKILTDGNGDGKPDRSTVFAEGLRLPTGIMKWKKGILVTDSPQVWYLEDTNGDGRADVKEEMLTGFALTNPQHTTNTPIYGLDNWIYLANEGPVRTIRYKDIFGDAGGEVRFPGHPAAPRLPPDADGRNVRFRPDTHQLEMLAARSQFGQTFDAWGHHFLVTNNRHMYQEVVPARYLSRNPALVVPSAIEHLPDYRLPATLFPITENPEFQLLTDVGVMTAASGLTYYLGGLFPAEYRDAAFVADGTHNLVHAAKVRPHGATFRASRLFDGREFLASTDSWFRPVNFYIGPDGALYLIDYYRKIIEHPEWLDETTARSQDLYAGRDRGRIYRIVPTGSPDGSWIDRVGLAKGTTDDLLKALAHPNVWWRRHAQRLFVDRKPAGAANAVAAMLATASTGEGRLHALWTLEGLGAITPEIVERALRDAAPGVRENAVKVAELHLDRYPSLVPALLQLEQDADPKVRFQLVLTLGSVPGSEAAAARTRILFKDVEDEWVQAAALSAAGLDELALLRAAAAQLGGKETPTRRTLFSRIGALAATAPDETRTHAVLSLAAGAAGDDTSQAWWKAPVLEGLAGAIRGDRRRSRAFDAERDRLAAVLLAGRPPALRRAALRVLEIIGRPGGAAGERLLEAAERRATDHAADPDIRAESVRLLALKDAGSYEQTFRAILTRPEPAPVQLAAVRALAEPKGERMAGVFVDSWDRLTPAVRDEAIRAFLREPGRIRVLLDAITAGRIRVSEIEWPLRVRMMMSDDEKLRERARALFTSTPKADSTVVARYSAAAGMAGDATRGREVFDRACSICHQYRGAAGQPFGPDLGEVRGRPKSALIADILQPNRSIADGYELWLVELADGKALSGIIAAETPTSVTFRQAGGGETVIARSQIEAMRIAPVSAMPEGLEAAIDLQQMADLIAYIKGGP